eukprot:CAMPEP_0174258336 /NCGR_PEP_ID=MMETSP0439-20130205/7337_1 /TAXON_ID=0 /ORGANISM="Stereomyxa ramosa, Strain Chinc5" /LENGTH=355 /DNA_ID=CAMNT_0015341795 /DNA_START=200 /DNA_END=1267 /DNA_ORIENTATION=+
MERAKALQQLREANFINKEELVTLTQQLISNPPSSSTAYPNYQFSNNDNPPSFPPYPQTSSRSTRASNSGYGCPQRSSSNSPSRASRNRRPYNPSQAPRNPNCGSSRPSSNRPYNNPPQGPRTPNNNQPSRPSSRPYNNPPQASRTKNNGQSSGRSSYPYYDNISPPSFSTSPSSPPPSSTDSSPAKKRKTDEPGTNKERPALSSVAHDPSRTWGTPPGGVNTALGGAFSSQGQASSAKFAVGDMAWAKFQDISRLVTITHSRFDNDQIYYQVTYEKNVYGTVLSPPPPEQLQVGKRKYSEKEQVIYINKKTKAEIPAVIKAVFPPAPDGELEYCIQLTHKGISEVRLSHLNPNS